MYPFKDFNLMKHEGWVQSYYEQRNKSSKFYLTRIERNALNFL